jgi:hypothetical protein
MAGECGENAHPDERAGDTEDLTHGESGKSRINATPRPPEPQSLQGQFEMPFGPMGPPTLFPIPVLRYMKTYGVTHEQMAQVGSDEAFPFRIHRGITARCREEAAMRRWCVAEGEDFGQVL